MGTPDKSEQEVQSAARDGKPDTNVTKTKTVVLPPASPEPASVADTDLEKVAGGCGVNSCDFTGTVPGR